MAKFRFCLNDGALPLSFSFKHDAPEFNFQIRRLCSIGEFQLGNLFMAKLPSATFGMQKLHIRSGLETMRSIAAVLSPISFTTRYAGIAKDSLLGELDPEELGALDPEVLEATWISALPLIATKHIVVNGLEDCNGLLLMDSDGLYLETTEMEEE